MQENTITIETWEQLQQKLTEQSKYHLFQVLKQDTQHIKPETIKQIAAELKDFKLLSSIFVRGQTLTPKGRILAVADLITPHQTTLQTLLIDGEFMSETPSHSDIDALVYEIERCPRLTTVKIEHMKEKFIVHLPKILNALMNLPHFKTLSLNDTLLDGAGIDAVAKLIRNNKLDELDLTRAGLINSNCFLSLTKAILQGHRLQKLILGNSPMVLNWAEKLLVLTEKKSLLTIEWQQSTNDEMQITMESMCRGLTLLSESKMQIEYDLKMFKEHSQQNPKVNCTDLRDFVTAQAKKSEAKAGNEIELEERKPLFSRPR